MKTKVIDPILCDERFRSVWALFRAVEEVLDLGCIRTFQELSDIVITLAMVGDPPCVTRRARLTDYLPSFLSALSQTSA